MAGLCDQHSKVEAILEELCKNIETGIKERKDVAEKQWDQIGKMVSTKTIWSGIGLFVMIMLTVVGFLWHNQTGNRNEILTEVRAVSTAISGKEGIGERLSIIEYRLDNDSKKKNDGRHDDGKPRSGQPGEISKGNPLGLGKK